MLPNRELLVKRYMKLIRPLIKIYKIKLIILPKLNDDWIIDFQKAAKEGKSFLFIGTKRQAAAIIAEEAQKCGGYYVNNRWLGGILTNWSTVKNRVNYLKDLNKREADGELDRLPKKEAAMLMPVSWLCRYFQVVVELFSFRGKYQLLQITISHFVVVVLW